MFSLTPKEHAVLQLVCKGFSNREIGLSLSIAETTARSHVVSIIHKLNVRNRTACAAEAIRRSLIA
ncbi:MAG: response regulator transcription factor [Prochlorococcus sp.]